MDIISMKKKKLNVRDLVMQYQTNCDRISEIADVCEKENRERRLAFYRRNGLSDTGARARTFGADFLILEFPKGEPHSKEEARVFYLRIYRSLLPERICERWVKIF